LHIKHLAVPRTMRMAAGRRSSAEKPAELNHAVGFDTAAANATDVHLLLEGSEVSVSLVPSRVCGAAGGLALFSIEVRVARSRLHRSADDPPRVKIHDRRQIHQPSELGYGRDVRDPGGIPGVHEGAGNSRER